MSYLTSPTSNSFIIDWASENVLLSGTRMIFVELRKEMSSWEPCLWLLAVFKAGGVVFLNLYRCSPEPIQGIFNRVHREHFGFDWSHWKVLDCRDE